MTQHLWDQILMLLSVMIMADGRVRDEEIDAFVDGVKVLQSSFEPGPSLTDESYISWFRLNETRSRELILAEPFEAALMPYLTELSELPNCQLLLDQLRTIADSDMHRDKAESDLLTLAAAFWGLVQPSADVDL